MGDTGAAGGDAPSCRCVAGIVEVAGTRKAYVDVAVAVDIGVAGARKGA